MKTPDWLVITPAPSRPGDAPNTLNMLVRVRHWHPGYWRFVLTACWQAWRRSVSHG